jgi:beta-1,4-mannosyl-glycoprotein beta-1,4-N-acetylglucosaminyltransferase
MKIFDCITFFRENFITNLRFEILNDSVDYFVICESNYDHRGNKKKLNFNLLNKKFKNKIIYLVKKNNFSKSNTLWENQAEQREYLKDGVFNYAQDNDYIMFSDPDEIPNPKAIRTLELKKKYGIFMQNCFSYKINLFNPYESPWEGTRICLKKNLKSINFMRQKVLKKNLKYYFFRIDKEKSIQLIKNGGWHFNNLFSPKEISIKLKTFAHSEYSSSAFSDPDIIKKNIQERIDLFKRGHKYRVLNIKFGFPDYILKNTKKFKKYII